VDGTGLAEDGRRLYFVLPRAPFRAMAQWCVAPEAHCVAVPEGAGSGRGGRSQPRHVQLGGADRTRAFGGETVLINGATGASGVLAVQIARAMGAGRVIATGRNRAVLEALGADATIALGQDAPALEAAFAGHFAQGVDVVLDYLWGPSAEALLTAAAKASARSAPGAGGADRQYRRRQHQPAGRCAAFIRAGADGQRDRQRFDRRAAGRDFWRVSGSGRGAAAPDFTPCRWPMWRAPGKTRARGLVFTL
jgi:hypothetical protein